MGNRVEPVNDLPETLEQLASRLNALEKRISDLEQSARVAAQATPQPAPTIVPEPVMDVPSGEQVSGAFLILGKSMLGIAGAYLLRAVAASGVLPRLLIAAVAIAYAIAWLVAASRASRKSLFAGALYAATASLIMAPMLWELTMRFHVLSPAAAAGVLGLMVIAATGLTWKMERSAELDITYGAAAMTALALCIVTHVMIAFLVLLLAMMAVCEYRHIRNGRQGIRMVVAAIADYAVWALLLIYRAPANTRSDYPAISAPILILPASLLLAMALFSVVFRTAVLQRRISAFEIAQSMITFLLWACSAAFLVPGFGGRILGLVCLLFASACYTVAYGKFRGSGQPRNFNVFALWGAALLLAGTYLSLPQAWVVPCLALASMAVAVVAVRACCTTLECHATIYLSVAAVAGGLMGYSFHVLAGDMPERTAWSILLVSGGALLCTVAAREREGEAWQLQLLHLVPILLAVCALAALAARVLIWLLAFRIIPGDVHVAFIRTLVLCGIACALAFAGSRWRRLQLRRTAYVVLTLVAAKLVFEDLRHGHLGYIAASIFLFALTLIEVPRLGRIGTRI